MRFMEEKPERPTPEPEKEGSDVYVRIEPEIKAGDLISASEYGYHRGYMKALRDVACGLVCVMALAVVLESTLRRE